MIYIRLDEENYIVEFSRIKSNRLLAVSNYPSDIVQKGPHNYLYINSQFIYNPKPIEDLEINTL
jgi:hypothetical protein